MATTNLKIITSTEELKEAITEQVNKYLSTIEEFKRQLETDLLYALQWKTENVLYAQHGYNLYAGLLNELEDSTLPFSYYTNWIKRVAERFREDLTYRDYWDPQSTSRLHNISEIANWKAAQSYVRFYDQRILGKIVY